MSCCDSENMTVTEQCRQRESDRLRSPRHGSTNERTNVLCRLSAETKAHLIARKRKYDSISATLRDALHWLPIRQRVEFKLSVLVFKCMHNLAPSYLSTICQPVADNAGRRHLRSAACGDLAVLATRTLRYGLRSFTVAGPSTWHSLPAPIRSSHLASAFRRDLKTELFTRAYHQHARDCF